MDKQNVFFDVAKAQSGEGSSLLDLDTGCLFDPSSSMSFPSIDLQKNVQGVHASRSQIVVEYADVGSFTMAPLHCSASVLSPSLALQVQAPLTQCRTPEPIEGLTVPVQVLSSTPREVELKPKRTSSLNLSFIDLTASQPSWEISRIKNASDSICCTLPNEPTSSPKWQSEFSSLGEISSVIRSGTSLQTSICTESRRPSRETPHVELSQISSVSTSDRWQNRMSVHSPENQDLSLGS